MKKAIIIILTALLVLSAFVSCNDNSIIDDEFTRTVTFEKNNEGATGKMVPQTMVTRTMTALDANKFELTDNMFIGWNTKADGSGTSYKDKQEISITEDMTLYAQWTHEIATVTFYANDGTETKTTQAVPQKIATALDPNTFTRANYSFTGWNTKADGKGTTYEDKAEVTLTADLTLYAQWSHDTVKVTFMPNGGTGDAYTQTVDKNEETELDPNEFTAPADMEFACWNTEEDGSGTSYDDEGSITASEDITLYAQWINAKVTITFKPNGGKGEAYTQKVEKDTETELVETTFIKYGYEFDHWNTKKDDTGEKYEADAKVTISEDLTLYAIWDKLDVEYIYEYTTELSGGKIYMIKTDIINENRLTIDGTGDVTLILPAGKTLTLSSGLEVVSGQSLVIEGEGTLVATGDEHAAGIGGGSCYKGGTITIKGGTINATGGDYAAGIGGGMYGEGGDVTILGGTVTAFGDSANDAVAIGHGYSAFDDGTLEIGDGLGLFGGADKDHTEFLSGPVESYASSHTAYMETKATTYVTVTFDANGGSGTMAEQTVPSGIEWKLDANEYTHKTLFFAGWALTAEGEAEYADQASVKFTEATTLYAKWIDAISLDDTYGGSEGKKLTGGLRYTIADDLPLSGRLAIDDTAGDVTLILPKGKTLTLEKGLNVAEGQALVIEGEGTLVATGYEHAAGIGGGMNGEGGDVTILGGTVTANGGDDAVGIGGGYQSTGSGTLTIGAGYVLTGGSASADTLLLGPVDSETTYTGASHPRYMNVSTVSEIKDSTSAITLKSGVYTTDATDTEVVVSERITVEGSVFLLLPDGTTLNAQNGITVASGNTLVIDKYGSTATGTGTLTATGAPGNAGIGGGNNQAGGTITINGGTVTATGGMYGAGIGGGNQGVGGELTIAGGTVTATGGENAAGIGGGYNAAGGTVTINGGTVTATGDEGAVGIGAGKYSSDHKTLKIADGVLMMVSTDNKDWSEYDGSTRTRYMKVPTPIELTSSTTAWTSGNVYTLGDENVKIESRITVNGTVFLLLPDGVKLTASEGITVSSGNTLVIDKYGSTATGTGILDATGPDESAGIGGVLEDGKKDAGTVIINGGTVYATGGDRGAGIGGVYEGSGGFVTINGGTVTATGGDVAAGIGGGPDRSGGTVTINGGNVTARGGDSAAGIGGGNDGDGGTVIINGGTVDAQGGEYAAGIGGGVTGVGATVTITGGTVTANGGNYAAGIGGGWEGDGGTVIINGGDVTATGGFGDLDPVAGIGAGSTGLSHGTLKIGTGMALYGDSTSPAQTKRSDATESYTGDRYRYMLAKQPGNNLSD